MRTIEELVNPHILSLVPYKSARDDFQGNADVYIDANESWYENESSANRYPDPLARDVRVLLEEKLGLPFSRTVIGNGSDELIDLLIRIFAEAGKDKILIETPTYGAYSVFASINNVGVLDAPLKRDLTLDIEEMKRSISEDRPKLTFICTPNNPTGKVYSLREIEEILKINDGITVVDEAYADFADNFESAISLIDKYPKLCVMRTLSKAWGIAGARIGILISDSYIRDLVVKVKPPYNVSVLAQRAAILTLKDSDKVKEIRDSVVNMRNSLSKELLSYSFVKEVINGDANFILVRVDDADKLYAYLSKRGIIVRNRTHERYLEGCLRITIGSDEEIGKLKEALNGYEG